MFCSVCNREVAPKMKIDFGSAMASLTWTTIILLLFAIFFTLGIALVIFMLARGVFQGTYKYCPVCFSPLTGPKVKPMLFDGMSDQIKSPSPESEKPDLLSGKALNQRSGSYRAGTLLVL